jgi:mevalonate kinase
VKNEILLKIPGKWILLGEHSVVRGGPALAFPLPSHFLQFRALVEKTGGHFSLVARSEKYLTLTEALEKALRSSSHYSELPPIKLIVSLESSIPVSSGQGSSAAICTAAAQLLREFEIINENEIFSAAHQMENTFHGTSSGLDIAAVQSKSGIYFSPSQGSIPLQLAWQPRLYLFDTGTRSSTKSAVEKVSAMQRADLDERMKRAVEIARNALESTHSLPELTEALRMGASCFAEWDLVTEEMKRASDLLQKAGAIAVKPTGSGNGGFLLSLWQKNPPASLALVPCFHLH